MRLRLAQGLFSCLSIASAAFTAPNLNVHILSATVKDQSIADADITVQKNGQSSVTAKTDAGGKAALATAFGADDASVTLIVKKAGYSSLVAKCPCDGMTYALSKNMAALDGVRVVLNWGENPEDLDSHFSFPDNHVYFEQKTGEDANLDVDDTDSFGPETITLERKHDGEKYVYAVHDYNRKGTLSSASNAKVFVYIGQTLIKSYYVPKGKTGTLWVVFGIDELGEIHDINKFAAAADSKEAGRILDGYVKRASFDAAAMASADAKASSASLNKQGETAYHAKDLAGAISLYQQAIELDGDNGQAYSNLGLAFQKNNQVSEAIWANRKAIALAHGDKAGTIRASSYYNIARIYEAQSSWAEAKKNYASALANKANPVYEKAIKKMDNKLAGK
jgi:uncharacterized protein YfaP (DUF2135 family)